MSENEYLITADGVFLLRDYGARAVGLGNIPVSYVTRQGYKQHGVTVEDYTLQPRTISLAFDLHGRNRSGLLALRSALLRAVSPAGGAPLTYRRVLPDGSRRDIQCWIDSSLSIQDGFDGVSAEVGLSLFCPDPSFYDPAKITATLTLQTATAFVLPFALPDDLWFAASGSAGLGATINNPGTWRAYPEIVIEGSYSRMVVMNEATGASFTLGVAATADDTITITLEPGKLSITRNGVLALDELEAGDLVNWYLVPGQNRVTASGSGTSEGVTAVQVKYNARYIAL